jgi:hypothetical protein
MSAPSKKIQVVVDQNVYNVLTKMGIKGLRGKSRSEVAYTILDEWLWHNQEKIMANGISPGVSDVKRRK